MKQITAKDIRSLMNTMIEKGIIRKNNDGRLRSTNRAGSTAIYNFSCTIQYLDEYIEDKLRRYVVWTTLLYCAMYYETFKEKPFDIIEWIKENVKPNNIYNVYSGNGITLCLDIQSQDNIISTKSIYLYRCGDTFIPCKPEIKKYNFSLHDIDKFIHTADIFSCSYRETSHKNIEEIKNNVKEQYNIYNEAVKLLNIK